jgi:hypothetical protein
VKPAILTLSLTLMTLSILIGQAFLAQTGASASERRAINSKSKSSGEAMAFVAPLAQGGAREVRAVNASGNPGGTVAVPVEFVAQGNENALAFSLTFDPATLSNPQAALGSGAGSATLITNPNQVAQGRLGVIVSLPTGQMFTAGTKQILVVTFTIASGTTANSTPVGFGDQPTRREVSDPNANVLPATFTPGVVTITPSLNPVPALTSLSPNSTTAGGPAFTLTVNGTNFITGSVVRWNGSDRATTFVSSTQLRAAIPASDIATAGTATITVFNPAPGGGTSNTLTFTIEPVVSPPPTLTSLSPNTAVAGGPAFTLTANGTNFRADSVVRWNGSDRATTFVSSTQLRAAIPASDIATAGTATITVFNPGAGGGTSNALVFTITTSSIQCNSLCFRSPSYFLLNLDSLPKATVLIPGANFNTPISIQDNLDLVRLALQGNPMASAGVLSPTQQFTREFVAAQLNLALPSGTHLTTLGLLHTPLGCSGLASAPVTLSNGFTFTINSLLGDLFEQARLATRENRTVDMSVLATFFSQLRGNDPLGGCQ